MCLAPSNLLMNAEKSCEMMRDSYDSAGSFNSCSALLNQSQRPTSQQTCTNANQREPVSFQPHPTLHRSATCVDISGMNVAAGTISSRMPFFCSSA